MENNQQLARQNRGTSAIEKASLSPQSLSILNELYLCLVDSKTETDERLNQEFLKKFANEDPAVIEWAFSAHRDQSKFFPAISEIRVLVDRRRRELWEASELERRAQEKTEEEKARADGRLVDNADVIEMVKATVKKFPEPPHIVNQRRAERVAEQFKEAATPAFAMTADEITARREAERVEIQRYQSK